MIAGSVVAVGEALGASTSGLAFGLVTLALCGYGVSRFMPGLRRLKQTEPEGFNPAPLYLVIIPTASLLAQLTLAGPVMEFSRNRAIANSAALINDIEQYHAARGQHPRSLTGSYGQTTSHP